MKAYTIKVIGVVQGVGFRFYSCQEARRLNLIGNVRNMADGSVSIQVAGPEDDVLSFIKWLHNGPKTSRVDQLNYHEIPIFAATTFEIIR